MIIKVQYRGEDDRAKALRDLARNACNLLSMDKKLEITPCIWNRGKEGYEPGLQTIKVSPLRPDVAQRVQNIIETIDPDWFMIGDRMEYCVAVDVR